MRLLPFEKHMIVEHWLAEDEGNLGTRGGQQWTDVITVGGLEAADIALAHLAGILQIRAAP